MLSGFELAFLNFSLFSFSPYKNNFGEDVLTASHLKYLVA